MKTATAQEVDGRTLRYQHRRPELLAALTEYILENGINNFSLRGTAMALGISHATLLRHFSTKGELIDEVVHKITGDFSVRLQREIESGQDQSLRQYMVSVWEHLCEPREQRQFLLLFELVKVARREPDQRAALAQSLVYEIIESIQEVLVRVGYAKKRARFASTSILAQIRGLQLDLAISGDISRVGSAMRDYISLIVRGADQGSRPATFEA
jgi:AcrR family transcriptional regulator